MIVYYIMRVDVAAHKKVCLIMKQTSFCELMRASQSFAEAAASLANAFADANMDFIEKKDVLCCTKFHLSLAISQYKRGERWLISFLKDENLNFCDLDDIPHTNEELI